MQTSPTFTFLLCALVLLLPAGLWLLVAGLRGKRVGQEPHCRRCGYDLTALTSDRCPECGAALAGPTAAAIVMGTRQRLWGRAIAGMVLLVLGSAVVAMPLVQLARQTNWYKYRPTSWVIGDLGTDARAPGELIRRGASLSDSQWSGIVERGLKEQAKAVNSSDSAVVDLLGEAIALGKASDVQKQQFLDQAVKLRIHVRSPGREGDRVPCQLTHQSGVPGGTQFQTYWAQLDLGETFVDGNKVHDGGGMGRFSGIGSGGSFGNFVPPQSAGQHTLQIETSWKVWTGPFGDESKSMLIGERKRSVESTFEVKTKDQVPPVQLLTDPSLDDAVRKAMMPKITAPSARHQQVSGEVKLRSAPCDLAFEVWLRTPAGEGKIGTISAVKGYSTDYCIGSEFPHPLPAKVTLIFRPSVQVAKDSVDLWNIYGQEVTYPEVPVEERK